MDLGRIAEDSFGAVCLARLCGNRKQAEGSLELPQDTANEAIQRRRPVDGGCKGERDVHVGGMS